MAGAQSREVENDFGAWWAENSAGRWQPPPVTNHEKAATGIKRIVMGSCSPLVFLPLVTYPSSLFLARISHHAGTLFGGLPEGRGFSPAEIAAPALCSSREARE